MTFEESLSNIEKQAEQFVWWSPSQIARGEDLINDPTKGQRAWAIPRATGEFLHEQVLILKPKSILELGTSLGYSTVWLSHAAAEIGAHVFTIEHMENKFELAKENIKNTGFEKYVTPYLGTIMDVLNNSDLLKQNLKFDFVFMDADRGHYHEYFPLLEPHLAENATIIADNAGNMGSRMQPFFELLKEKGWTFEILDMDNGILLARKNRLD
ncbi:MAG: hypothetical protein JWM20_171 [Patescibacteria group bacterium]|nr:hypothetical protein [Patescibacteria group bacterium]